MIGIIGAMAIEIETIRAKMDEKEEKKIGVMTFVSGKLYGKEIVTTVCGIGKVAAAIGTQTMIMAYKPECIINTGVAGSLSAKLHIGDVVVADSLCQHDMDTSPLGDPLGLISGINLVDFPTDERVRNLLLECTENKGVVGKIASGDQFIHSTEQKEFIISNFNAVACEMEGAAIAQTCYSSAVPYCVLRAISDSADGSSHMDYSEFLPIAAKNAADIIERFVKAW